MSDEGDAEVSKRYRELAREEPPRELDHAVLAAAHRAADRPHAPLVAPAGRHRWYFAFGAAAVVVLAVSVTIHMEHERPDPEAVSAAPATQSVEKTEDRLVPEEAAPEARRDAPPASAGLRRAEPQDKPGEAMSVPAPAAPAAIAEDQAKKEAQATAESQPAPAAAAPARPMISGRMADASRPETPERWVERILELRKQGKHDEAEKQLAEFRRQYPDYKLPDAALKK